MPKRTSANTHVDQHKRDLNAELTELLAGPARPIWARKTEVFPQKDGSLRRVITRSDGTVEQDELISAERALVAMARAATGLSQAGFARLLGVSVRTVQEWEQGRKSPSGAAMMLLKIAAKHPEILHEVAA